MYRVFSFLLYLLYVGCSSSDPDPAVTADVLPPPRPNIVLIVADDLGWSDLGCYGNPFFESPHLDGLAGDGIRFTQAYAACHVCSPTRASILTGRYPARIGLTNYLYGTKTVNDSPVRPAPFADRLPLEEVTLAERMKEAGYRTGLIGKWHLGENTSIGESDPDLQGFDMTESWDYGLLFRQRGYEWFHTGDSTDAYQLPELTEEITSGAQHFIRTQRDTAFFLMVAHYAVHLPLQGEGALVAKYAGKPNPRPDDYHPVYAAMIEQMDASVGRIRGELERQGLADNTLIVFVSDNGGLAIGEAGDKPTVNDPLRAGKGTMYEGGIRVPLIAYWPGRWVGGRVSASVINTVDLFPTLLSLVEHPLPDDRPIDGSDVLAAFDVPERHLANNRDLYWHYPHFSNQGGRPRSAIRRGDYKLIESLEDGSVQLYNLAVDPGETTDISGGEEEMVKDLRLALARWREETDAPMPLVKPSFSSAGN